MKSKGATNFATFLETREKIMVYNGVKLCYTVIDMCREGNPVLWEKLHSGWCRALLPKEISRRRFLSERRYGAGSCKERLLVLLLPFLHLRKKVYIERSTDTIWQKS